MGGREGGVGRSDEDTSVIFIMAEDTETATLKPQTATNRHATYVALCY